MLTYKTLRQPIRLIFLLFASSLRFHAWWFYASLLPNEWPKLKQPNYLIIYNRGGQDYSGVKLATFWKGLIHARIPESLNQVESTEHA